MCLSRSYIPFFIYFVWNRNWSWCPSWFLSSEITVKNNLKIQLYEGCSNMNASGFITFFTYMLRQNGKRFYKGLYVTFKVAPDQKKNTVYLSSYSPLDEGHVCILTNSMLRTSTSDRDDRIILRRTGEMS